jgi:hypothetical protein
MTCAQGYITACEICGLPVSTSLVSLNLGWSRLWSFLNSYLVMSCFEWLILLVRANLRSLSIIVYGLFMACGVTITSLNIAEIFWAVLCSLSKYYEIRACCMLFKTIKTTYPSYLNENLLFDSSRRRHRLLCLTTPNNRTFFYGKTFFVSIVNSCNSWNRLPVEVRCSASMDIFKRACLMFLAGGAEDEQE